MMDLTKVPLNEYGHVQTRDGRPARLLCVDAKLISFPVAAFVQQHPEKETVLFVDIDGSANGRNGNESDLDLIPIPRKVRVTGWLNVYAAYMGYHFHESRADADEKAATIASPRIACIEIDREVTKGEGL